MRTLLRLGPLSALVIVVLLLAPSALSTPTQCDDTRLSRTFQAPAPRAAAAVSPDAFELTREDFLNLYAFGLELHIGLSPYDGVYAMDVGYTADAGSGPGAWVAPEIDFDTIVWTIVDPATTPYAAQYPAATHALVTTTDPEFDGTRYQFFTFEDHQLVFDAYLDVPADGSGPVVDSYTQALSLFPLNTTLAFEESGYYYYEDDEEIDPELAFPAAVQVGFHGYGTLTQADGSTVETGAFYSDFLIYDPDDPEELFESETIYSFFGVDGTWLNFFVAAPPETPDGGEYPIEGEVLVEAVEYWQVMNPATAGEPGPSGGAEWTLFPNPTTDVVRFSEPLTATLFDMMGRAVREATRAREVDLRGLASGTYVVRSEAGASRTLTVRR
ncbi:T9SS type A sorting domain-containing protein [Rubrivirga sp. IMCC43871]|uniref:T9SS type A sorting domain-containing protein n=1 Tax=Rubrivirga sp. IMCC43871 TaxID=3391575 RepID=UPI00398FBCE7